MLESFDVQNFLIKKEKNAKITASKRAWERSLLNNSYLMRCMLLYYVMRPQNVKNMCALIKFSHKSCDLRMIFGHAEHLHFITLRLTKMPKYNSYVLYVICPIMAHFCFRKFILVKKIIIFFLFFQKFLLSYAEK